MGCFRKIRGRSRISHIRNTDIKNQLNIQRDIVDRIRSRRLRYFGHVVRMQLSRWPHWALYGRVRGNRWNRGWPRQRWTDNISDDGPFTHTSNTRGRGQKTMEGIHEALRTCLNASPWHRRRIFHHKLCQLLMMYLLKFVTRKQPKPAGTSAKPMLFARWRHHIHFAGGSLMPPLTQL